MFDYKDGDIFACVADIGWITGHTYVVYGPLSNAATTVLFESTPVYPDPGRYWEMVERLKVNQLYLSPTALRLLLKSGDSWVKKYDRSTLKKLGCGENYAYLLNLFPNELGFLLPRKRSLWGYTGISLSGDWVVGLSAKSCPDNFSYSFSPIPLILGRSVHKEL